MFEIRNRLGGATGSSDVVTVHRDHILAFLEIRDGPKVPLRALVKKFCKPGSLGSSSSSEYVFSEVSRFKTG